VAEGLSELWKQSVVIENHPGAGGAIAANLVAKAPADGYTLLMGGQSNLAIAAALNPTLHYDPLTDFAPIGRIAHVPTFVIVNASVPAKTIPELLSYARAHPGRLTFVSFGDATVSRLAFQQLMASTGIDLLEIPYKGSAPALADLLAGRVDMAMQEFGNFRQHRAAGTLRALGASGATRATFAPDIPTVAEQGVDGFKIEIWYGLVAPVGVPDDVLARLRDALERIRRMPDIRRRIEQSDFVPIADDPAQFAAVIRSDIDNFSRLIQRAGMSAERKAGAATP
jgi:tripartite-type tricarboxylate transporter receptor subunit TctC